MIILNFLTFFHHGTHARRHGQRQGHPDVPGHLGVGRHAGAR